MKNLFLSEIEPRPSSLQLNDIYWARPRAQCGSCPHDKTQDELAQEVLLTAFACFSVHRFTHLKTWRRKLIWTLTWFVMFFTIIICLGTNVFRISLAFKYRLMQCIWSGSCKRLDRGSWLQGMRICYYNMRSNNCNNNNNGHTLLRLAWLFYPDIITPRHVHFVSQCWDSLTHPRGRKTWPRDVWKWQRNCLRHYSFLKCHTFLIKQNVQSAVT